MRVTFACIYTKMYFTTYALHESARFCSWRLDCSPLLFSGTSAVLFTVLADCALYLCLCMCCVLFVRAPGTLVPKALCFTADVFFLSPRDLRAPSADCREILPRDRNVGEFYNASPKIRGALPPKKLGAKNMQNSARFQITSDFDRKYLRNETRYPKSEKNMMINDSSRV